MTKEDNSICFGMGLLAGVLGGIAAGVLFAPKSGAETRREVKEAVVTVAEKYTPEVVAAKRQAMNAIDVVRYKLEKQYNKINNALKARQLAKAKIIENGQYEMN